MKLFLLIYLLFINMVNANDSIAYSYKKLRGESHFSWLFFEVYHARLYAPAGEITYNENLSLELIYKRNFSGHDILKQTLKEFSHQGHDKKIVSLWRQKIKTLFPDVKTGDSILANYDSSGVIRFYLNKTKYLGEISDRELAMQFLNIWLGTKTSEPSMRNELLGENV